MFLQYTSIVFIALLMGMSLRGLLSNVKVKSLFVICHLESYLVTWIFHQRSRRLFLIACFSCDPQIFLAVFGGSRLKSSNVVLILSELMGIYVISSILLVRKSLGNEYRYVPNATTEVLVGYTYDALLQLSLSGFDAISGLSSLEF